ncbi:MAG: ATP phosphoribosyltransferase regulatory subunit [Clostridiales bacterium]|nr:ATP phosphoribosyltransferase regulatory subunit [Clostridiales bacterium]
MKRFDLVTPEGTRDLLFEDCLARRKVEGRLHKIFKAKGYCEVITPSIEFYDVFDKNSRYFPQEEMYKLFDLKGRIMVMRPDSTIPIARLASTSLRDMERPLRLFYNQNIFVANPSMMGRSDEIIQTGIELIGSSSKRADLEVLCTAIEVLDACDAADFNLEIGNIAFFKALISHLNASDADREKIRHYIEVKNYPALNELLSTFGDSEVVSALKELPRLFGGEEVLEKARKIYPDDDLDKILSELGGIYNDLKKLGLNGRITVDLGLVNRTDYYTGVIFRGYIDGCGEAILSGGRYDKLISEFGYDIPATGFAANVDAIAKTISDNNVQLIDNRPTSIVFGEDGYVIDSMNYFKGLISEGIPSEYAVFDCIDDVRSYSKRKGIAEIHIVSDKITVEKVGG